MQTRSALRTMASRIAPALMADRARRYEAEYRESIGATAVARSIAGDRRVSHGPFAGLLLDADLGSIDAAAAKLSGTYEQELTTIFEEEIERPLSAFIDVGCADGYYVVGMALAQPDVTSYGFDLSFSARKLCRRTAVGNRVADRVRVRGRCDLRELLRLPLTGALVLIDIEGAERTFLDAEAVELLRDTRVIVEVHEDEQPGLGALLASRFDPSHRSRRVSQTSRTPGNPRLEGLSPEQLTLALAEHRGPALHWLDFTPLSW